MFNVILCCGIIMRMLLFYINCYFLNLLLDGNGYVYYIFHLRQFSFDRHLTFFCLDENYELNNLIAQVEKILIFSSLAFLNQRKWSNSALAVINRKKPQHFADLKPKSRIGQDKDSFEKQLKYDISAATYLEPS